MKFISTILFAASMAAAAPTTESPGHPIAHSVGDLKPKFGKREYDWANDPWTKGIETKAACGLYKLPDAGQGSSVRGFRILGDEKGAWEHYEEVSPGFVYANEEGKCSMIWCDDRNSYGSAFYLCREKGNQRQEYSAKEIAAQLHATFFFCYGHEPDDDDRAIRAYKYFGDKYSVFVQGDANCGIDRERGAPVFDAVERVKNTCLA